MTSKKKFCAAANYSLTSESSSLARALIHVATLPREWIAVLLSVRNEKATTSVVYVCSVHCRLLSLCCRCGMAAVLLLLLLLGLFYFCCCYAVPDTFVLISFTAAVTTVLTVVRFLLPVGCWEDEFRDLSLYKVCVRPCMQSYQSRPTCVEWYTLSAAAARCCCC